jgi:hypothetical protein
MKPKEYEVLTQAVEAGVLRGIRLYYKHRDDMPEEQDLRDMAETASDTTINEICEWFSFEDMEEI